MSNYNKQKSYDQQMVDLTLLYITKSKWLRLDYTISSSALKQYELIIFSNLSLNMFSILVVEKLLREIIWDPKWPCQRHIALQKAECSLSTFCCLMGGI